MKRPKRTTPVMAISEHELSAMTSDLDQLHHDVGMPAMHRAIDQWNEKTRSSRRGFLIGAGAVGLATVGYALFAPKARPAAGMRVLPAVGSREGGLVVAGAW